MKSFRDMRVLADGEIEAVAQATEDLIESHGVCVRHKGFLRAARAAGAQVDDASGCVRIPRELLRDLLAQAPRWYAIRGPGGAETIIGDGTQRLLAIVTDPWIVDYETGEPRRPRMDDVRRHTTIAQKLDEVACVARMDFPVADVDGPDSSLRALEEHLLLHDMHSVAMTPSAAGLGQWIEIGDVLAGDSGLRGSRLLSVAVAVVSPLSIPEGNAEMLMAACEYDLPVIPTVCPMAGTTSPYTMAGTLVQGNAENCFVAAAAQMLRPGHPFLYAFGPSVSDMRSGHDLYYTLDKVLWKTAAAQMARHYGLPCSSECGGSMTWRYDQQSGAEGMLFMLAAQAAGSDVLAGIGSCHNANGMSAEMMLIQTSWLRAARHLGNGIGMDAHRMAVDSIVAAGHGGDFLTDDLTLEFLRGDEFFTDDLLDLGGGYEPSASLLERAHAKVEEMTAECESPLPGEMQEALRRYFRDARD